MRGCTAATAALLNAPPPGMLSADLFTVTLQDGVTVYNWTSFDWNLNVNGTIFSSRKPWLERSNWNLTNTMEIPTLQVFLRSLNDGFAGGADIKSQIHNGLFDGANLVFRRVFTAPNMPFVGGSFVLTDFTAHRTDTVNLNAVTNAATTAAGGLTVGVTLSGYNAADTLAFTLPTGLTYTAWSPWGTPSPVNYGHSGSANYFNVIRNGNAGDMIQIGSPTLPPTNAGLYDGFAAARAAFPGGGQSQITGATN